VVEWCFRTQPISSAEKAAQWALSDSLLRLVSKLRSSKELKARTNRIEKSVSAHSCQWFQQRWQTTFSLSLSPSFIPIRAPIVCCACCGARNRTLNIRKYTVCVMFDKQRIRCGLWSIADRVLAVICVDLVEDSRHHSRFSLAIDPLFCQVKADLFLHDGEVLWKHHGLQVWLDASRSRILSEIPQSAQVIGCVTSRALLKWNKYYIIVHNLVHSAQRNSHDFQFARSHRGYDLERNYKRKTLLQTSLNKNQQIAQMGWKIH